MVLAGRSPDISFFQQHLYVPSALLFPVLAHVRLYTADATGGALTQFATHPTAPDQTATAIGYLATKLPKRVE
jgi:hypothetical protein